MLQVPMAYIREGVPIDTPPQIGFNRWVNRLVIETDTIHCTPAITNANTNVVLRWQIITENPAKNFNIINEL